MSALLNCGHPSACASTGAEGTSFCMWCEEVGRLRAKMEEMDVGWEATAAAGAASIINELKANDAANALRAELAELRGLVREARAYIERGTLRSGSTSLIARLAAAAGEEASDGE